MKLPRVRLTIKLLMVAVAVVALLIVTGQWAFHRYWSTGTQHVYPVTNLLANPAGSNLVTDLPAYAERLKSSVTRDVWWSRRRSVTPFLLNGSLIVVHTAEGHEQVVAWLEEERLRRLSTARTKNPLDTPSIP